MLSFFSTARASLPFTVSIKSASLNFATVKALNLSLGSKFRQSSFFIGSFALKKFTASSKDNFSSSIKTECLSSSANSFSSTFEDNACKCPKRREPCIKLSASRISFSLSLLSKDKLFIFFG